MSTFRENVERYMSNGFLTINNVYKMLEEAINDGYGESILCYKVGVVDNDNILVFPISDLCVCSDDKSNAVLTSEPRIRQIKDRLIPEYEMIASFEGDTLKLKFSELIFKAEL